MEKERRERRDPTVPITSSSLILFLSYPILILFLNWLRSEDFSARSLTSGSVMFAASRGFFYTLKMKVHLHWHSCHAVPRAQLPHNTQCHQRAPHGKCLSPGNQSRYKTMRHKQLWCRGLRRVGRAFCSVITHLLILFNIYPLVSLIIAMN